MTEWIEYTGSEDQRNQLINAKDGFILRPNIICNHEQILYPEIIDPSCIDMYGVTHFLICEPHPLARMIWFHSVTGAPVWVKLPIDTYWNSFSVGREFELLTDLDEFDKFVILRTNKPDWDIPGAIYSFTTFEEE